MVMRLPVEVLINIARFIDNVSLLTFISMENEIQHSVLCNVFNHELRARCVNKLLEYSMSLSDTTLSNVELCLLCDMFDIVSNQRQDGMYTIDLVNTFIDKNMYRISSSKRFGINKWCIMLYCKIDIEKIENCLKSSQLLGKHIEFRHQNPSLYTIIQDTESLCQKIYIFKVDYESIQEKIDNATSRSIILCSYTFLI